MESIWLDGREAKKEKRMRTMYGHHLQSSNQISNDGYFVQVLAIKSQRVRSPRLECGSGRYRRAGKMETQEVFTLSEQQEGEPQFFFFSLSPATRSSSSSFRESRRAGSQRRRKKN